MKKKILLLNPPGKKPYSRDGYCSHEVKSRYLWPPAELVYQSGFFSDRFEIEVLDAIASRIRPRPALEAVSRSRPDAILSLIGLVSWEEDRNFLREIKEKFHPLLIVNGDICQFRAADFLQENEFLDAVLTDPLSPGPAQYLEGAGQIPGLACRRKGEIVSRPPLDRPQPFSIPIPRYHLFPVDRYRLPFGKSGRWGITLTGFGCPYQCAFCNQSNFPFSMRDVDNFIEELHFLDSLKINNLLFREAGSTHQPQSAIRIMERIISEGLRFNWTCQSRPDTVNPDLLKAMKKAGCFLIMFGIESGSEQLRKIYKTNMTNAEIINLFALCRSLEIQTLSHFILGLPEETPETIKETIRFAKGCGCDYASFNIFTLRPGINFSQPAFAQTNPAQVRKAQNLANLAFYLRPKFIFNRFHRLRSSREFLDLITNGLYVMLSSLSNLFPTAPNFFLRRRGRVVSSAESNVQQEKINTK